MNLAVGFRTAFNAQPGRIVRLAVAGATVYRIFLNGDFIAFGPARGPHKYFRVDVLDLTRQLKPGKNVLCVEVAGYNVNSYYILDQPSFLQAEVTMDSTVLASTAGAGEQFEARVLSEKLQKVQRYSFQRSFSEIYHLDLRADAWRRGEDGSISSVMCAAYPDLQLIPRRVPYPAYAKRQPEMVAAIGTFRWVAKGPKSLAEDRSVPYGARLNARLHGYPESELVEIPYLQLQKAEAVVNQRTDQAYRQAEACKVGVNEFKILDFGTNLSGFFGAHVEVMAPTKLYFVFDETLTDGDIDFTRLMCVNIVAYTLAPGTYNLECFEPYVLRFLKVMVSEGECQIKDIYLREYVAPDVWEADFHSSDEGLNELFAAGRETYRQNSVDLFTDTPSRERAGWLCDSGNTAQVAPLLSGHTLVEKCYLENYLLPDHFAFLPEGMIPSCYPADHYDGYFTPNWALWFILQVESYLGRSGDRALVDGLRPRVLKILDYFKPFENEDGLLEKLNGTVFIEWSKANDYAQDVNFPTNMLYAAALGAVARMYELPDRLKQAGKLKKTILSKSYNGEFFVDNAIRQGGRLSTTGNRTETCQYYAFYFDIASFESHAELWQTLRTRFGPTRRRTGAFPDIAPSNAMIGNVMRIELLSRAGLTEQLIEEAKEFYLPMAELTGTFWENMGNEASMDHAFGSYIIVHLFGDVLGIAAVDPILKSVHLRFSESSVSACQGRIPTKDGFVKLRWSKNDGSLIYQCDVPAGYTVHVENRGPIQARPKVFPHGKVEFGYKIEGGYK